MKDLSIYTDDELREELKRRAMERRKNTPREILYVEFEATIKYVENTQNDRGKVKYKPLCFWKYKVTDCSIDIANQYNWFLYYMKQGAFKRDSCPKIGDRVKLRYRRTKKQYEQVDLQKAKIVEIIK
jgi:hypothetical protein